MQPEKIIEKMESVHTSAKLDVINFHKAKSKELRDILSLTLEVCEDIIESRNLDAVKDVIHSGDRDLKFNKTSDVYWTTCKYIFHETACESTYPGWARILRHSHRLGVRSDTFAEWLTEYGYANAQYNAIKKRKDEEDDADDNSLLKLKHIVLSKFIEVPKDKEFTIKLRMNESGKFDALEVKPS